MQRAKLPRAAIAEGLVGPFGGVPFDPVSNGGAGFAEAGEVMLPDALFFEAAKEAFDETVLFGSIRRGVHPKYLPFISRIRRLFCPPGAVRFVVV